VHQRQFLLGQLREDERGSQARRCFFSESPPRRWALSALVTAKGISREKQTLGAQLKHSCDESDCIFREAKALDRMPPHSPWRHPTPPTDQAVISLEVWRTRLSNS
jgi:hypothetical protein